MIVLRRGKRMVDLGWLQKGLRGIWCGKGWRKRVWIETGDIGGAWQGVYLLWWELTAVYDGDASEDSQ